MPTPANKPAAGALPFRVMVVDDSAVTRGIVTRWLEVDPAIEVVASCSNGEQALKLASERRCDIVMLDIEMPVMDGLTALPQLLKAMPGLQVIMSSTLTRRNADISLRALSLGAADYIAKPEALSGATAADDFRRELITKIKALGAARSARAARISAKTEPAAAAPASHAAGRAPIVLRRMPIGAAAVLAIGSSTGGPNALIDLMRALGPALTVPVVIAQHMPPTFTTILAENIGRVSGRPCAEGVDGEALKPGSIYVARGDYHMTVTRDATGTARIAVTSGDQENFCRPAVDPLFRSVAQVFGARALALVLTGMGHDGREGARALVAAGGAVFAQDEASSVVWGMPGAVAMAGLCSAILPLERLGAETEKFVGGGRRGT